MIQFGRYELLRKIATGGMGQIILARKGSGDFAKIVIIKRILPNLVEDEEFFKMFRDEAMINMRLEHPNIVRIHEFDESMGVHFIEMEYVAGDDMRRIEKTAAKLGVGIPIGIILRIVADAAAGLDYAHKAKDARGRPLNLVHRDVSPQNILVGFDGSVKLIDFGVAKAAGRAQHTATGILKGKFPYMSPEQATGKPVDARSDVFSLGIILWEFLTARRLFKGANDAETQRLVRDCQVPRPSSVEPSVPPGLDSVVLRALAKDSQKRFADAQSFRMAIEEFALKNAIPASSAHLSAFMHELYAERIAEQAEPSYFEPDASLNGAGLEALNQPPKKEAGAAIVRRRNAAEPDAGKIPSQRVTAKLESPEYSLSLWKVGIAAFVTVAALSVAVWHFGFRIRDAQLEHVPDVVNPVETAAIDERPDDRRIDPPPQGASTLQFRIETLPPGASIELEGKSVGKTPSDLVVERSRLPLPVALVLEGYEPQRLLLTSKQAGTISMTLKKRSGQRPSFQVESERLPNP